jgi:hypothetical protein
MFFAASSLPCLSGNTHTANFITASPESKKTLDYKSDRKRK